MPRRPWGSRRDRAARPEHLVHPLVARHRPVHRKRTATPEEIIDGVTFKDGRAALDALAAHGYAVVHSTEVPEVSAIEAPTDTIEIRFDVDSLGPVSSCNMNYVEPVQSATMLIGRGAVDRFNPDPKRGETVEFPVINGQGSAVIAKRRRRRDGSIKLWLGPVTIVSL